MPEFKIARFVGIEACKSIFSERSTFVLRSPHYYRRLYEMPDAGDSKADRNEGTAETLSGGSAEFSDFLVSCWTVLEGDQPTRDEWNVFAENEQNVVAIVTTPTLVSDFLREVFRIGEKNVQTRFPFVSLEHREVSYEKEHVDHRNIAHAVPFTKSPEFSGQKEYRFVLSYAWRHAIDTLIFCAGLDYMQRREDACLNNFANPKMSQDNKAALHQILLKANAGYGDFTDKKPCEVITNADILFPSR
ncbi:MAG: hypothetical protein ACYTAS_02180 [Planctomycetota bacterium]|jgi:hypothetical protein